MEEKFRVKNTLGMFDLLKGILMIFMMVFHTDSLFDGQSDNYFVSALIVTLGILGESAMAMLFVISGYGFRKTTFKKCINRLYKTIVIPYIVVILIMPFIFGPATYIQYHSGRYALKQAALILLGGLLGVTSGPCWFLLALIESSVIFNELVQRFEGKKLFIASLIVSCMGWGLSFIPLAILPYSISQGLMATFFIYVGYFVKKNKLFTSEKNKGIIIALTVFIIALYVVFKVNDYEFNMAFSVYPFGPIAILGVGLLAFVDIYWMLRLNRFTGIVSSGLRSLGRNSLYVLCIHAIELVTFGDSLQQAIVKSWQGATWTRNLFLILGRAAIVIPITYLYVWAKGYFSKRATEENSNKMLRILKAPSGTKNG